MAHNAKISNALAQAILSALATFADGGTGAVIEIYDGAQPTDADTAIGSQVKLATLVMDATAFGSPSDANPGAIITADPITPDSSADATGTATWFRMKTQAGGSTVLDGSVGTSNADLVFNTVAFTAGSTVSIDSFTITMPESA